MTANDKTGPQLRSLQKWRESLLDDAQADHASKTKVAVQRAQEVSRVRANIDESQDLARSQLCIGHSLSIDSLTRIRHYMDLQSIELERAEASFEASQLIAAQARSILQKRHEEVKIVERLRERRSIEAKKNSLRNQQLVLDEQALMRAAVQSCAIGNLIEED